LLFYNQGYYLKKSFINSLIIKLHILFSIYKEHSCLAINMIVVYKPVKEFTEGDVSGNSCFAGTISSVLKLET